MFSRRTFLAGTASAAALLAGCTVGYTGPPVSAAPVPPFTLELTPLRAREVGSAWLLDHDSLSKAEQGTLTNLLERGEWLDVDYEPVVHPDSLVGHDGRVYRIGVEPIDERVVESALVTVEYAPDADWQAETTSGATPLAALSTVDRPLVEQVLAALPPSTGPAVTRSPYDLPSEGPSRLRDGETVWVVVEGDGYRIRATGTARRTSHTYRYTATLAFETVSALGEQMRAERAVSMDDATAAERAFLRAATASRVDSDGRYARIYQRLTAAQPVGPELPPAIGLDGRYYAAHLYIR